MYAKFTFSWDLRGVKQKQKKQAEEVYWIKINKYGVTILWKKIAANRIEGTLNQKLSSLILPVLDKVLKKALHMFGGNTTTRDDSKWFLIPTHTFLMFLAFDNEVW